MDDTNGLSDQELAAEGAVALPDKEVVSILDLNADLDLAIDAAAPIDLAVAANANVAAPIDAAVGANILSTGSTAQALADQGVMIDQNVSADATADSTQDSGITQGASPDAPADDSGVAAPDGTTTDPTTALPGDATGDVGGTVGDLSDGDLLNVDVDLNADANIAAPVNGAVAANANVAAPIDAAVAANVGSIDSDAVSVAQQDAIITQNIEGSATANADQTSTIDQP